jgi:hypothetical protein
MGEILTIVPATNYLKGGGRDMKRMIFRKVFLLSGILILSVLFLGQLGWACDEPDHPYYQCTEEPDINRVKLDYDKDIIYIYGKNFTEGTYTPVVTLGDLRLTPLPGFKYTDNELRLIFPEIEAGDYKLTVVTGETRHCRDKQSIKITHDNEPSCPPAPTCPPTCPAGPKGDTGATGPQGLKGETGATGLTGATGPQGPAGATGAQGPAGAVGAQGPAGPKGDTGATGPQGLKGDKGDQGLQGIQGIQGPKGDTGATGPQGPVGPIGLTGADGPQGLQGEIGPAGPKGEIGPQGIPGAAGAPGSPGSPGATGTQGPQGETGEVGPAGPQGETGAMGPQGPKGDTGATGATGAAGPGIFGWKIVPQRGDNFGHEYEFRATATCDPGYQVTGGGFWQNDLDIRVDGPLKETFLPETVQIDTINGWYVAGTPIDGNKTTLIVYAICACVDAKLCGSTTQSQGSE